MASIKDTIRAFQNHWRQDSNGKIPFPKLDDWSKWQPRLRAESAEGVRFIENCLEDHAYYRKSCLNLIASENAPSDLVGRLHSNELSHRYGDYAKMDPEVRKYLGTRHIVRLERFVLDQVKLLFAADYVDIRPLSGHVAGIAVLTALCEPGDTVLELDAASGGHRLAQKFSASPLIDLKVAALPFDARRFNVDVDRSRELIYRLKPRIVILGSSNFLFPHPVAAMREIIDEFPGTVLLYDASHVLGLIAGGRFQNPLREGAHIVATSTHKTFAGPQGGMILTNDGELAERVAGSIYPALLTNHHLHRIPAIGASCLEWLEHGRAQATAVVTNAQAFAHHVVTEGIDVVGNGQAFTQSHTVLLALRRHGESDTMAKRLEEAHIIADSSVLPRYWGRRGLRLGFQEVTRRGMKPGQMRFVAKWIADLISGRKVPDDIRHEVQLLADRLDTSPFALE